MASLDNWDGFYPACDCQRCGKPLQGQGSDRPAELYAGTYNGICYVCTNEGIYEENYSKVSGARVWSHPPHCPSWRRDREVFFGFDDCQKCNHGRIHIPRSDGQGGSYGRQCEDCWNRHMRHPLVKAHEDKQRKGLWRYIIVTERAQLRYNEISEGKAEIESREARNELLAAIRDCIDNRTPPPEVWPALKAADRKKLLKRAPGGLEDSYLETVLKELGGNPRTQRKTT